LEIVLRILPQVAAFTHHQIDIPLDFRNDFTTRCLNVNSADVAIAGDTPLKGVQRHDH
jgi:hypothetical protein